MPHEKIDNYNYSIVKANSSVFFELKSLPNAILFFFFWEKLSLPRQNLNCKAHTPLAKSVVNNTGLNLFFQALFFTTVQVVFITARIAFIFTSLTTDHVI